MKQRLARQQHKEPSAMDFRLTAQDEAFRLEVRDFIRKNWDPKDFSAHDINVRSYDFDNPASRENDDRFVKKLVKKGWYTMHWPKEWGGQEAPFSRQFVYTEELGYANAPGGQPEANITGAIMIHGSDYLQKEFLPKMAKGDIHWAQGFSEPNAGTDLASLQTRAVEEGDEFVVTGQKMWSSGSQFADWYHILVRTDPNAPKHRGISYLVMQLRDEKGNYLPGITRRPIIDFFGRWRWNEFFLDGVRVPKRNIIGEVNRGWYAAMTVLNFERTGIDQAARHIGAFDRFVAMARKLAFNGKPVLDDPLVKHKLADLRIVLEVDRLLAYRVAWMQAKGEVPQAEGAMSGWRTLHTSKYWIWPTFAQILGPYMALQKGEGRAPGNGMYGANYMLSQNESGGGGGIALGANIIAWRGLGLPR
jgi:alkylation response protein AidB-like acyl-CoA dehydrogenase